MHVKNTWGSHCDKLIFMSSQEDLALGAVALNISEGRQNLWGKTKKSFEYCYQYYRDKFDWFVKADDDTFMIIENLKGKTKNILMFPNKFRTLSYPYSDFLRPFDTNEAILFGHRFDYYSNYSTSNYSTLVQVWHLYMGRDHLILLSNLLDQSIKLVEELTERSIKDTVYWESEGP